MHMTRLLVSVWIAIVAIGCSGASRGSDDMPTAPSPTPWPLQDGTMEVAVSGVRVFLKDGRPQAYVEGPLGDGCTHLDPVIQERRENTIRLTMTATREGGPCTMIFKYFNEWVPLAGPFDAGLYRIHVNRATAEFLLLAAAPGGLRVEPDPGPLPVIPPPTPGAVSPNDPPGGTQTPGQIPGVPGGSGS